MEHCKHRLGNLLAVANAQLSLFSEIRNDVDESGADVLAGRINLLSTITASNETFRDVILFRIEAWVSIHLLIDNLI